MSKVIFSLLVGLIMLGIVNSRAETKFSVESMPPVVVETIPRSGDIAVDPSIKEIRVTFSKDMMTDKMWSWVMVSKETFPKLVGDVRFLDDKKTCIAPVELEPGKTYVVWFNSEQYNAFRDKNNNPAVPYLLVFQTKE